MAAIVANRMGQNRCIAALATGKIGGTHGMVRTSFVLPGFGYLLLWTGHWLFLYFYSCIAIPAS